MDRGRHFATIISALSDLGYRIEWRLLNAKDFSLPQNRQRVLITGVHKRVLEERSVLPCDIEAIRLANSSELNEFNDETKYKLSNEKTWGKILEHDNIFPNWGIAYGGLLFTENINSFEDGRPAVLLKDVVSKQVDSVYDLTDVTLEWIKENTPVNKFVGGVEVISNQAGGARMGYTIFGINGLAPTLTSSTSRHYERYFINGRYRRLTPEEYAQIQGFPMNHCDVATLRDRYVLFGNAVPPNLTEWVIEKLLEPIDSVILHYNNKTINIPYV
jgi:DNA (cytosine-5)-methyltransferase 1